MKIKLKDNLLIVCPNSYKEALLQSFSLHKELYNIKFMNIETYQKNYFFDYDQRTIHYLRNKSIKVENAIDILNNLYYVENKNYHNKKLDYLVNIKKELDEEHLLIYNPLFKKILERREVIVYGYGRLDAFQEKMFNLSEIIPFSHQEKKYDVYPLVTIEEEVEFVFQRVADLLKNGIDINRISLMNLDIEYYPYLKRMSSFYQIPIEDNSNDSLMGTIMGQEFYRLCQSNLSNEEIVERLETFKKEDEYAFLIELLNKYYDFHLSDVQDEIKYELYHHSIKKKKYQNVLRIKQVFDYIDDDEYVFLMNFNQHQIPIMRMDTDYITNNLKEKVGLSKIEDKNLLMKENTLDYLSNIKNLIISYKEKSPFNKYYPSNLLDEMDYERKNIPRSYQYSDLANQSLYTKYLDDYVKYGLYHEDINKLYQRYQKNDYLSYDNQFKCLDSHELKKYLNNELTLSYSSMNNFYQCGFKYYLSNILKLDLFEETFMTIIGNLFHFVLSHMNDEDFDLHEKYQNFLKNRKFTNKEQFFLNKLEKDLTFIIETIKRHQNLTGFDKRLYEKKIDIKVMDNPYVHFKGFVDKIMYRNVDNITLVSIIDYKTGLVDTNLKNLPFGLSMQLPVYLYLVHEEKLFPQMKFTGFYLQHILNNDLKKDFHKTLLERKYHNLKLMGYSTDDLTRLSIFDSSYENSEMIKGIKLKKDGTLFSYANLLSDTEVEKVLTLTKEKIMEATNLILKGEFMINPKILNGKNVSCEYCPFKDICYREEKNNIYLQSEGGDNDAELDEGTAGSN